MSLSISTTMADTVTHLRIQYFRCGEFCSRWTVFIKVLRAHKTKKTQFYYSFLFVYIPLVKELLEKSGL
jgi:hypothetical protein